MKAFLSGKPGREDAIWQITLPGLPLFLLRRVPLAGWRAASLTAAAIPAWPVTLPMEDAAGLRSMGGIFVIQPESVIRLWKSCPLVSCSRFPQAETSGLRRGVAGCRMLLSLVSGIGNGPGEPDDRFGFND